jgi:carboxylesterase type B
MALIGKRLIKWFEDDLDMDDAIEQFSLLVTDSVFTCPNYDTVLSVSPNNTYFYRYAVDAICSVASVTEDCEEFSC